MANETQDDWKPLSLPEAVRLFAPAGFPWWIAGGHAIELAAGLSFRKHEDIDILVLRKDHLALRDFLKNWDCWASDPHGRFRPWKHGEALTAEVHDIWCREYPLGPWRFQVMLDEANILNWYSRRDSRVTLPLTEIGTRSEEGIPYVRPEVLIYYKAKQPRPKDELDFDSLLPILSPEQRRWASNAIRTTYGDGHPWISRLHDTSFFRLSKPASVGEKPQEL